MANLQICEPRRASLAGEVLFQRYLINDAVELTRTERYGTGERSEASEGVLSFKRIDQQSGGINGPKFSVGSKQAEDESDFGNLFYCLKGTY